MNITLIDENLYAHYDLEHIIRDALLQQLDNTGALDSYIEEHYHITENTSFLILGAYLGQTYTENHKAVESNFQGFSLTSSHIHRVVMCVPLEQLVLCILYTTKESLQYNYFQKLFHNEWNLFIPESSVFMADFCTGLRGFYSVIHSITSQLDWNLIFGSHLLLNLDRIDSLNITPLKYPTEIDGEVEKTLVQHNTHDFTTCFQKLYNLCRQEVHTPAAVKSICVRYALVIAYVVRINGIKHQELDILHMVKTIINAIYWVDIWNSIYHFALPMLKKDQLEKEQSLLVIETRRLIYRYYCKGITLEEIADKLHVSEEYLSTTFKKETGITFSETIRALRIDKVKELLISSNLKINAIAELAGYSDGKYMSRVFKDVTGMSPTEYRKARAH